MSSGGNADAVPVYAMNARRRCESMYKKERLEVRKECAMTRNELSSEMWIANYHVLKLTKIGTERREEGGAFGGMELRFP